jgi:Concanavalin A-like lectin/glucanases superfamily/PKD domain
MKTHLSCSRLFVSAQLVGGGLILILSLVPVSHAGAQTCVQPPSGLVSWWPGDTNADDIEDGNNGTLQNGVMFAAGMVGQALSFDGIDDYVNVPDSTSLDITTQLTIDAWVMPSESKLHRVITKWGLSGFRSYNLDIGADGRVFFYTSSNGADFFFRNTAAGEVPVGQWTHVAAVYKAGAFQLIYVNGIPKDIASGGTAGLPSSLYNSTSPFRLARNFNDDPTAFFFHGALDEVGVYNRALSASEIQAIFNAGSAGKCQNTAPTANAGMDQAVRPGETVLLDGRDSFDDNSASAALIYAWSFSSKPAGSSATLIGASTATPSFFVDNPGTYVVQLIVTDEGGLSSAADEVLISSNNLAPTANAGDDILAVVGGQVTLDGSSSSDPELDSLIFTWTLTSAPAGSTALLNGGNFPNPTFVPDVEGTFLIELVVSDLLGPSSPDTVIITATSANNYAEIQILEANEVITALPSNNVTTGGNQNALTNFLSQAVVAIQSGDLPKAKQKLQQAIERTDGCVLRGALDDNGPGRDWITDCAAQIEAYAMLNDALAAITP